MRNLQINTSPITPMQYVTPEIYDRLYGSTQTGTPEFYTIIADELQLGPIPGSAQTIEMLFYKKFDALTSSAPTNWMITNAPDVYLYGCLLEAEPFIMNDPEYSCGQQPSNRLLKIYRNRTTRIVTQAPPLE